MIKRTNIVVIAVVLGVFAFGTGATAQEIEWERAYSEKDTVPLSGGYYSGRHILPMPDGGYVVTSLTGGGYTAAVARFDSEGIRLWDRSVTDIDTNIYGTQAGHDGNQVALAPRFSYIGDSGRVILFANEWGQPGFSNDHGVCYQLVLDQETGVPLDTLVNWPDSTATLDFGSAVCQMRDGRFFNVMVWPYPSRPDTLGMLYFERLTAGGGYDVPYWYGWHSVGERKDGEEVWHYPARVIQTPDGGFVIFGTRQVTGGAGTLFLLKIDSLGAKVWEGQSKQPETMGRLAGTFFDTTAEGGFILLSMSSYVDATAERKRWRVMHLTKFSAEGVEEWSREYESAKDYTTAHCVRQTEDGGYLLLATAGGFNATYTEYRDSSDEAFLLKTDSGGKEEWRKTWGGPDRENLWFMLRLADGSVIVTGNGGEHDQLYLAKIGTAGIVREEEPAGTMRMQPNPARDRLRVSYGSFGIGGTLRLYDLLGREVLGRSVALGSSGSVEIDVSELPAGAYQGVIGGKTSDHW